METNSSIFCAEKTSTQKGEKLHTEVSGCLYILL